MKKLCYFVLALALLLVLLFVGNVLYQRYSLTDGMTNVATYPQGDYIMDGREFYMFEVVSKRKDRFSAVIDLATLFLEGEREDDSLYERTSLPEYPAKFSYVRGIWEARFMVMIFSDGYAGIAERFPTAENKDQFLQSLVPFEPPPNYIIWKHQHSGSTIGDTAGIHVVKGEEIPVARITVSVSAKPH